MRSTAPTPDLHTLAMAADIIVCCGTGGVGKTTVAAALALHGARAGRTACVVTIDPAKRLADALGLGSLSDEPARIDGDWSGELWALMLDTKTTFDNLVLKYAPDASQAQHILENRLYRNLSAALSGTHEYMAMEKLFELHDQGEFDLIVVDTPPTRSALDFLDAPRRLTGFLDNRIFRWLTLPGRAYLRAVSIAAQTFLRTVSRVVGAEVIQDAIAFFRAFEGMEEGFRQRAHQVLELLSDPGTSFVLVASPRRDALEEAEFFAAELSRSHRPVQALVVNRLHPDFGGSSRAARLETSDGTLRGLRDNLAQFHAVARNEERHLRGLVDLVDPAPVARVPLLAGDIHDVAGLDEMARHLFPHTAG